MLKQHTNNSTIRQGHSTDVCVLCIDVQCNMGYGSHVLFLLSTLPLTPS